MDEDMVRYCMQSKGFVLNPIIDWTTDEVWEFIHRYNIPYCELYDQGFTRLGCIGCPMASVHARLRDFEKYPKIEQAYKRAFTRMMKIKIERRGVEERKAKVKRVIESKATGEDVEKVWDDPEWEFNDWVYRE